MHTTCTRTTKTIFGCHPPSTVLDRANKNNVVRTEGSPTHSARHGPAPVWHRRHPSHTLREDRDTSPLTQTHKSGRRIRCRSGHTQGPQIIHATTAMHHGNPTHNRKEYNLQALWKIFVVCMAKECRDAAFHTALAIHVSIGSTQPPLLRFAPRAARAAPLEEVVTAYPYHRALWNKNQPHGMGAVPPRQ
ncbi:hypothetical protein TcCL_ESM00277 [Trypanosoma cruzi]|nr:hypothetical protein TcCL_ESM00277 [Trypanosoma cruzi]